MKNHTIFDIASIGIPEIEKIGKYTNTKSYNKPLTQNYEHQYKLIYLENGIQEYCIAKQHLHLRAGEMLIIRPGEYHSAGQFIEKRGTVYWLIGNLNFSSFLGSDKSLGNKIIDLILHTENRVITLFFDFGLYLKNIFKLEDALVNRNSENLYREKIKHTFFLLYTEIYEQINNYSQISQVYRDIRIIKTINFIEKNIEKEIDINTLSLKIANMSFSHFSREFKRTTGYSPRDFVNLRKIENAKFLLKEKNVTSVSSNLGFSSTQYFATVFKKYTGVSPTEYLKSLY